MRSISAASLVKLATHKGTEPVNIMEIQWQKDGPKLLYSEKYLPGIPGKILTIESIEDVINVSKSGTSQSVSITLDDIDGHLKQIFNTIDIHKKKVWIYQWFTGIPLSDKFLLFNGVIASPVIWKESDRTLSFSVISQSEDREVGFSPEEGAFPNLPQNLIGSAWPLVFGSVKKLPAILIDNISYSDSVSGKSGDGAASVTKEPTGIKDPSLEHRIKDNDKNIAAAGELAKLYFLGYLQASFTARKRGELDEFDSIDRGKGYFSGLAKQYLQQGNNMLLQAQKIKKKNSTLNTVQNTQKTHEKVAIGVTNGNLFPQGKLTKINLAGAIHEGVFVGDSFEIKSRTHPQAELYEGMEIEDVEDRTGLPVIPRQNFFYADAGIPLKLGIVSGSTNADEEHFLPVRYIVAATLWVTVENIFAYRTVNGFKQLMPVPFNYYSWFNVYFGTLPVTMLFLNQPLSSRTFSNGESEGWEDEIWVSCTSAIGPNTVDILKWLIENYTGKTWDTTSFTAVRAYLAPYPMHFAVRERPNVLSLISDIAYQARCIVWLKNDIFYIKYLSKEDTPIDTITRDDILEQSLEISYTETEDIVTKYIAHWQPDYKVSKPFASIFRYNVSYYGLHEKDYNFYCYNMQQLVDKSATFWLIREANTFKRVKMTVPISKLKIETLDTVTLDLSGPYIANGAINCVVEESRLNTENYTIDLTLWVPVRAGEMTKYLFAYMGDLQVGYYFPTEEDINSGRAGSGHDVPFNNDVTLPEPGPAGSPDYTHPMSGDPGNGGSVSTTTRPHTWGADPTIQNDIDQIAPEILSRLDVTSIQGTGAKPSGTTKYQYDQLNVKDEFKPGEIYPRTFPGIVIGKEGESDSGFATYNVNIFPKGFGNTSKAIIAIFTGPKNQIIEPGSGVMVSEVFINKSDATDVEYYMQVSQGGGSGRMFPGKISEGTGDTYTVDIYREGLDGETESVEAIQLQIDEDETIPEDSWVFVNEIIVEGSEEPEYLYYIQMPVWL